MAGSLVEKGLKSPVVPAFNVPELSISFKTELAETLKENVIEVITVSYTHLTLPTSDLV